MRLTIEEKAKMIGRLFDDPVVPLDDVQRGTIVVRDAAICINRADSTDRSLGGTAQRPRRPARKV